MNPTSSFARLVGNDICVTRSGKALLNKVSLSAYPGELVGLIGPNGAGKSTLLGVLAGLVSADHGEVSLDGAPLHSISARQRAQQLGWLEQQGSIYWPVNVERLVTLGRLPYLPAWQVPSESDHQIVQQAMADCDCLSIRERDATTLSGGERARALLARAMAAEPDILLADEPVSSLDLGHQLQTMDLLRQFSRQERTCVVVLHDLSLAARYCDRLYLLDKGQLIAYGSVADVLGRENLRQVYGVDVVTGFDEVPWIVPLRRIGKNV
jgi:iron complex transport system ATP-binding protein